MQYGISEIGEQPVSFAKMHATIKIHLLIWNNLIAPLLTSAQTMEMPLRYRLQIGNTGRSVEHKKLLDEIWPHGDKNIQFGHNTLKQDRELK